ncbi:MAG: uracil phosphoribosyltransferase, partial [Myxococcaceae bacterium]
MRDSLYENLQFRVSELAHHYGKNVHLVGNPYLLSLLAQLCAKDTQQPAVNTLVRTLYTDLITMV